VRLLGGARIGEGALIAAVASVLHNKAVGDWATVGIGSAVLAPVENGITVFGNPARALPLMRKNAEKSARSADPKIATERITH